MWDQPCDLCMIKNTHSLNLTLSRCFFPRLTIYYLRSEDSNAIDISMGTNCASLIEELSPYSYEDNSIQDILKKYEMEVDYYLTSLPLYRWCPFKIQVS